MQIIKFNKLIDEKVLYFICDCSELTLEIPCYIKVKQITLYVHKEIIININNKGNFILIDNEIDVRYKYSDHGSFLYLTPKNFFKHNVSLGEE